jgi:hypothetical protein
LFFTQLGAAAGAVALAPAFAHAQSTEAGLPDLRGSGLPETFAGHRVVRAGLHLGAIVLRCEAPDHTTYQIDMLARAAEGPRGVRETARYALFMANRGSGRTPTNEQHGLGLVRFAEWLGAHESRLQLPTLSTFVERQRQHPRGAFLIL